MRHQQANAKAASAARAEDPLVALPLKLKSIMELLPSPSILTPEELDVLHDAGARLYARGAWKEASDLFGLINLLRPLEPRYLNAQGKCLKMLKDFEGASEVFLLAW
jgi:Flp pilus assembly protein TadD